MFGSGAKEFAESDKKQTIKKSIDFIEIFVLFGSAIQAVRSNISRAWPTDHFETGTV
jgi:hypothetical protein